MMKMMSALHLTRYVQTSLKQQFTSRHVAPLAHIIPTLSQPFVALVP